MRSASGWWKPSRFDALQASKDFSPAPEKFISDRARLEHALGDRSNLHESHHVAENSDPGVLFFPSQQENVNELAGHAAGEDAEVRSKRRRHSEEDRTEMVQAIPCEKKEAGAAETNLFTFSCIAPSAASGENRTATFTVFHHHHPCWSVVPTESSVMLSFSLFVV